MEYNVIISSRAKQDISKIGKYIAIELYSPVAARKLMNEIENQITNLSHMPKRFALVSDERLALLDIRSVPVKNYNIFYIVSEHTAAVTIISIIYHKRDWTNLLQ